MMYFIIWLVGVIISYYACRWMHIKCFGDWGLEGVIMTIMGCLIMNVFAIFLTIFISVMNSVNPFTGQDIEWPEPPKWL